MRTECKRGSIWLRVHVNLAKPVFQGVISSLPWMDMNVRDWTPYEAKTWPVQFSLRPACYHAGFTTIFKSNVWCDAVAAATVSSPLCSWIQHKAGRSAALETALGSFSACIHAAAGHWKRYWERHAILCYATSSAVRSATLFTVPWGWTRGADRWHMGGSREAAGVDKREVK
jgi:hypothetical protein